MNLPLLLRKALTFGLCLGVLAGLALFGGYQYLMGWGETRLSLSEQNKVLFASGNSLRGFAGELHQLDVLDRPSWFVWLARLQGLDTQLQAGEYALQPGMTPMNLLRKMAAGKVVVYQFRIQEGYTVAQILAALGEDEHLVHTLTSKTAVQLAAELMLATPFAEGMFFPDTYQFSRGETDRDLLRRAHGVMLAKVAQAWRERAPELPITDADELVILASIIEKESGTQADRAQISQVFHRRLARNMLLQTDPTVIYGVGREFDGNLTRAHLRQDTPYNTYTRRGLPPTPIAIPSAASLQAAAHPAAGDYLYFVARGDGSSQFSRTLAEHNSAVRRYQLGRSE